MEDISKLSSGLKFLSNVLSPHPIRRDEEKHTCPWLSAAAKSYKNL